MRHLPLATLFLTGLFSAGAVSLAAQDIDYKTARLSRRLPAVRASGPIDIDGRLEEPAWRDAPLAKGFIQSEPREGRPATFDTEVKILYDDENIYFGVFNLDDDPRSAIVNELKKDFSVGENDLFGIVIDTFHDERNGYQFEVNPKGARWDAQCFNDSREVNANWDGVWYVATSMAEDGWYAEFRIPMRTMKFTSASPQTWGVNFLRRVRRINEDSYWAPLPRFDRIHRVSLAGTLEGLQGLKPGKNIRVKPYASTSASTVSAAPTDGDFDFGIDAKVGVTTGLTWDFTVNTDFSQVEADEQQVNLTRFSLFFPEKRDFFLENSGVFQFGPGDARGAGAGGTGRQNVTRNDFVMFFSRRVGLSDTANALPILGGTRLTGRAGAYTIGALNIQQREDAGVPATNVTALRLRRNILANSDVGVIFLNKAVAGGAYNRAAGLDANFRFFRNLTANAAIARTFTPERRLPGSGKDVTVNVETAYRSNFWDARGSYLSIGERFNDELGFIPRVGMDKIEVAAGIHLRPRRYAHLVREMNPRWQVINVTRPDGRFDSRYYDYRWTTIFQDGTNLEYGLNTNLEDLVESFSISSRRAVAIQPGRYGFNEHYVQYRSNQSAPLAVNARVASGAFYEGDKRTYQAGFTTRFNEHLNVTATWTRNDIDLPEGAYTTDLVSTRVNYGFSTRTFLNALIQYNTDARQWTSNVRFNIIHRPLSDFFLVYNDQRDSRSGDLLNRALIAKYTYMMQF